MNLGSHTLHTHSCIRSYSNQDQQQVELIPQSVVMRNLQNNVVLRYEIIESTKHDEVLP